MTPPLPSLSPDGPPHTEHADKTVLKKQGACGRLGGGAKAGREGTVLEESFSHGSWRAHVATEGSMP